MQIPPRLPFACMVGLLLQATPPPSAEAGRPATPVPAARQATARPHSSAAPALAGGLLPIHRFNLDGASHATYGLSYPITLVFALPPGATGLTAHKYAGGWVTVPTRLETEVFSGVEAARFDDDASTAYLSIAFPAALDAVWVAFTGAAGEFVSTSFEGIARYYDGSKTAVVISGDDWQAHGDADFVAACNACQARQLWFTPGICTRGMAQPGWGPPDWALIQREIDDGFVEPASHSRHHLHPPYDEAQWGVQSSYAAEIDGSRQDILDHLELPPLNRRGAVEHLYAWIEPFTESDSFIRRVLGQSHYLCDRRGTGGNAFAHWDSLNGLYERIGAAVLADTATTPAYLNARFDFAYDHGLIHHLLCHPRLVDWQSGPVPEHLDHIANRPDVWYVGFGHLYAYHYLAERDVIHEVSAIGVPGAPPAVPPLGSAPQLATPAPNPFASRTEIAFDLPAAGEVRLAIYDTRGRLVRRLVTSRQVAGRHLAAWNGHDGRGARLASGVYFLRLEASGSARTRKLTLRR